MTNAVREQRCFNHSVIKKRWPAGSDVMRRPLASLPGRPNPTDSGDAADLSNPQGYSGAAALLEFAKSTPLLISVAALLWVSRYFNEPRTQRSKAREMLDSPAISHQPKPLWFTRAALARRPSKTRRCLVNFRPRRRRPGSVRRAWRDRAPDRRA